MLLGDNQLDILIIATFAFIGLYYLRRSNASYHDEVIAYTVMAGSCAYWTANIILGQFAQTSTGILISYGALGLFFYAIAAIYGIFYTALQIYLFIRSEVVKPIESGHLEEDEDLE